MKIEFKETALVESTFPDGVYLRDWPERGGYQVVVIGPMPFTPRDALEALRDRTGREFRACQMGALKPCEAHADLHYEAVTLRGYWTFGCIPVERTLQ